MHKRLVVLLFLVSVLMAVSPVSYAHDGFHLLPLYPGAIGGPSLAQSKLAPDICDSNDIDDLQKCIDQLEKKIKDKQRQEATLQNQIDSINDQIRLIQLKIQEAQRSINLKEAELVSLGEDIGSLAGKIDKLSEDVSYQTLLLNERVQERYMSGGYSPLDFIFGGNLNEIVQRLQYIKELEDQDTILINRLNDTKHNYQDQKLTLEQKKAKVEELKKSIEISKAQSESYKASLSKDRAEKDALLAQTKGDEAIYQDLLRRAKAEVDAIQGAVSGSDFGNGDEVKAGDPIARMGNSGYPSCSTGAHLHFEVRRNGSVVNSEGYLKPQSLYVYDYVSGYKTIGSGSWPWPMRSAQVTQRYGRTPWSYRYPGNSHTGVDIVSSNTTIYAPASGTLIKGTVSCYSSAMKYAAISHSNGVVSYYFHIQ